MFAKPLLKPENEARSSAPAPAPVLSLRYHHRFHEYTETLPLKHIRPRAVGQENLQSWPLHCLPYPPIHEDTDDKHQTPALAFERAMPPPGLPVCISALLPALLQTHVVQVTLNLVNLLNAIVDEDILLIAGQAAIAAVWCVFLSVRPG
ncbi:hypothetical protein FHETE_1685 [Fusarium heterosporum]|uniref:Uncharacterized protein n=1 Tax=Fusarium heterosporum TaxID=42747 RepID=A0A8H5TSL2_FUSHE|nr:hypothetical protein FHETE_1685 [Fusarium heterosporum]